MVAAVAIVAATLGRLPATIATHFDGHGVPNAWSSHAGYLLTLMGIGLVLPLAIVGLVGAIARRWPQGLNIPHREYWLARERVQEAVGRLEGYLWWLGCIMLAATLAIHLLILDAHTSEPPRLSLTAILVTLAAIVVSIGFWIVGIYRNFRPLR